MTEPKALSDIIEAGIRQITNVDPAPLSLTPDEVRRRLLEAETEKEQRLRRQQAIRASERAAREREWAARTPPVFRITLDDLPEDLKLACGTWLSRPRDQRRTFILAGPTGVGKTYAGYATAHAVYMEGDNVIVHEVPEFVDRCREEGSAALIEEAKTVDLLFFDELKFHTKSSDKDLTWAAEKLLTVIDYRWKWGLPMIFTTNVQAKNFPEMFGDRLTSRLLYKIGQEGGTYVTRVKGDDRRITG